MMRVFALLTVAVSSSLLLTNVGSADGLAEDWTGPYIGANLGGHFGHDDISTTTTAGNFATPAFGPALDAATPVSLKNSGVLGGIQIGYNWQSGRAVLGLEADANWLGGSASRNVTFGPLGGTAAGTFITNSSRISFLSTLRPRLGWAFGHSLVYGTAGLAIGSIKTRDTLGFPANFYDDTSSTDTRAGWTVGGGAEVAIASNWTAKIEYLYVDFGTHNISLLCGTGACPGGPVDSVVHHDITDNIIRFGLNYEIDEALFLGSR